MKSARRIAALALLAAIVYVFQTGAQETQRTARPSDQDEQQTGGTMRPVIRGAHAAVSSMKPEATRAAENILRAGGNAFDAAVAGQAVLALVDPASNGIGSDAEILIYDAKTRQPYSINAEAPAPKLATIEWYNKNNGGKIPTNDGLLSGSIPGTVDAWYLLLDRWGTMSFEKVLEQAIDLAENGFPIGNLMARAIQTSRKITKYATTTKIYLPDGKAPNPGDIFRNPALARTLKKLVEAEKQSASKGRHAALQAARDRFYKGDIAVEMAKFSEANGGLFRYEDFAAYTAKVEEPVSTNYRGYQIFKNPSASQGPSELFALNMLEGFDLKAMGHNSTAYIHTTVETLKLAMGDREKYLGDMDFIRIPYEGLLSKEYAVERRKLIDPDKASLELRPGTAEKFVKGAPAMDRPLKVTTEGDANHDGDTSYIAVVDDGRNMITLTPSLHSAFGTGVAMGELGFIFNCRGDYYSLEAGEANALAPGKRPRSTLQGTLVMKDGQPLMVMGTPGADNQV